MSSHLHREMEEIKMLLFTMGGMVEDCIRKAVQATVERNLELAKSVIRKDDDIDNLEIKIEEESLKTLALYTPVAEDLRFITTVMKINNDLERMADLAANICERAVFLSRHGAKGLPAQFDKMGKSATEMVQVVLKAFLASDAVLARRVVQMDDAVDALHREILKQLIEEMKHEPEFIEDKVQMLWASRNLERIADHATNIAEDIVYMVEGVIIRHQQWDIEDVLVGRKSKHEGHA